MLRAMISRLMGRKRVSAEQSRHGLVGQAKLWEMKRAFQFEFLKKQGLQPADSVLDIGCGVLRGGLPLIAYLDAGGYCGLDVRAEVLQEARAELRDADLTHKGAILLHSPDLSEINLDRKFDYIWAFSVLFHMTDPIMLDCLGMVRRHLKDDGVFFANQKIGEAEEGKWQGFPVVTRPQTLVDEMMQQADLEASDLGELASLGHHSGQPVQDSQRMFAIRPRSA